jgi:hypothetical protein
MGVVTAPFTYSTHCDAECASPSAELTPMLGSLPTSRLSVSTSSVPTSFGSIAFQA